MLGYSRASRRDGQNHAGTLGRARLSSARRWDVRFSPGGGAVRTPRPTSRDTFPAPATHCPVAAVPKGRLAIAQHFSAGSGEGMNQVPIGTAETACRRFLPRARTDPAPGGARRSRRRNGVSEGSVEFPAIVVPCGRLCGVNAALRAPTQRSSAGLLSGVPPGRPKPSRGAGRARLSPARRFGYSFVTGAAR